MPRTADYQQLWRSPYAAEANEKGPDRGLWSVLGRAIRSQVPERRNEKYDPSKPIDGENTPYQRPGFFRALAGDRGGDFNRAAMLNQDDINVGRGLADRQAQEYDENLQAEEGVETRGGLRKFLIDRLLQSQQDTAAMRRVRANNKARAAYGNARNSATLGAANLRREAATALPPERRTWYKEDAEMKRLKNRMMQRDFDEDEFDRTNPPAAKPGLFDRIGQGVRSIFGGGRAPAPAQRSSIPTTGVGNPSDVIDIDPADLAELQGGNVPDPYDDDLDF